MRTFGTVVVVVLIVLSVLYLYFELTRPDFKAYIDGIEFEAKKGGAKYNSGRLKISAVYFTPDTTILAINLNASKTGTYQLNNDNPELGNVGAYFIKKTVYATNSRSTGSVTITKFDLDKKQVSGTFEFKAAQAYPPGSRVIEVTEGEFRNFPID